MIQKSYLKSGYIKAIIRPQKTSCQKKQGLNLEDASKLKNRSKFKANKSPS